MFLRLAVVLGVFAVGAIIRAAEATIDLFRNRDE